MIKKQNLNMFKKGSLAVLLGLLGFVGTSVFATDACHAKNSSLPANESHKYTCETNADGHCPDGFDDTRPGQL